MTPQQLDEQQRRASAIMEMLSVYYDRTPEQPIYPPRKTQDGKPERFEMWAYLPNAYFNWRRESMRPVSQ